MFDRLRRGLGIGLTVCLLAGLPVALPKFARAQTGRVNRALLIGVDDFVSRDSTYPASTNNVFAMGCPGPCPRGSAVRKRFAGTRVWGVMEQPGG